jgi:hypothetical protein
MPRTIYFTTLEERNQWISREAKVLAGEGRDIRLHHKDGYSMFGSICGAFPAIGQVVIRTYDGGHLVPVLLQDILSVEIHGSRRLSMREAVSQMRQMERSAGLS